MNEPGIDLTGKLIIKVALGDDIRRILITNEDITYDELVLMMQRVYRGKLNSSDDIVIKYKDEDNDLITIFESSDLNFAIQCSRILKITLFVNGKPEPLQTDEVKMIKSELKYIRERCNKLIDTLDDRQSRDTSASSTVDSTTRIAVPQPNRAESPRTALPNPNEVAPRKETGSKEFDPLSTHRPIEDSQKRSGTPDSITSVGSASLTRPQQRGGTPTIPAQQAGQMSGMFQQGSGQKVPPWQSQLGVGPSQYSPSQTDEQAASVPQGYTSQPQSNQPQPGYGQPAAATSQYGVYNQQQSSAMPGQHLSFVGPQQQQPGAFGSQPQQPAPAPQQQIPQQLSTYAYAQGQQQQPPLQQPQQQQPQQQQPGFLPASSNPSATTANPYARHGSSYAAGYPRPTGNYAGYH